ncbi:hypothetical protein K7432_007220 [Basidiobolus ranarum]|uniref:Uncharacterized protein n=1 Tax=Basidiobolus ranarum TaxID=34480 RepID=A0ABR2W0E7_9FUNG
MQHLLHKTHSSDFIRLTPEQTSIEPSVLSSATKEEHPDALTASVDFDFIRLTPEEKSTSLSAQSAS